MVFSVNKQVILEEMEGIEDILQAAKEHSPLNSLNDLNSHMNLDPKTGIASQLQNQETNKLHELQQQVSAQPHANPNTIGDPRFQKDWKYVNSLGIKNQEDLHQAILDKKIDGNNPAVQSLAKQNNWNPQVGMFEKAQHEVSPYLNKAKEGIAAGAKQAEDFTNKHPYATAGIAAGTGAVAGAIAHKKGYFNHPGFIPRPSFVK